MISQPNLKAPPGQNQSPGEQPWTLNTAVSLVQGAWALANSGPGPAGRGSGSDLAKRRKRMLTSPESSQIRRTCEGV